MQKRNDTTKTDVPSKAEPAPNGERIAKVLARAGIASRRDAEKLIAAGRIKPQGRPTVFENLPQDMPRVISVGRLDMTSEGLLLLTNDGELARMLELPSTAWARRYRARAYGHITQDRLDTLKKGITIDGIPTGPIEATIDRQQGDNAWIDVTLREGKNREVRRALDTLGLRVNRLIRVSYGPFQLAVLPSGQVEEVKNRVLRDQVGHLMEIEKTREGGPITSRKSDHKGGSAKSMPQGKGRNAKPKRKAVPVGGRDISAKAAKRMIAERNGKKPTTKPTRGSSKPRPSSSRNVPKSNTPRNTPRGRR